MENTFLPFTLLFSPFRRRRDAERHAKNRKNLFLSLYKADHNIKMVVLERKIKGLLVNSRAALALYVMECEPRTETFQFCRVRQIPSAW